MLRFEPMQRIFVTGGTGFVGKHVIRALLAHGFLVRCLVRPGSEEDLRGFEAIDRVPGDALDTRELAPSVEGCAAIVHLVGIIREQPMRGVTFDRLHREATAQMVDVARRAGVKRFVHMSALGTRADARSGYHRSKWAAEEIVRDSGLDWTILRPSVIYGRGDEFVSVFAGMIRRLPVVPVIGSGQYPLQPIAVEHVAEGFARSLLAGVHTHQVYELGGPHAYPFVEILDLIGQALGHAKVRKVHAPLGAVRLMTKALQWLPAYPVSSDQLLMLEEGNITDPRRFYADFALEPEPLDAGLARMLAPA